MQKVYIFLRVRTKIKQNKNKFLTNKIKKTTFNFEKPQLNFEKKRETKITQFKNNVLIILFIKNFLKFY